MYIQKIIIAVDNNRDFLFHVGLGIVAQIQPLPSDDDMPPLQPGDKEVTLENIIDVCVRVGSQWEKVAVKLRPRVGDDVIRNARENRFASNEGKLKAVLEAWHDEHSTEATMRRLEQAVDIALAPNHEVVERDAAITSSSLEHTVTAPMEDPKGVPPEDDPAAPYNMMSLTKSKVFLDDTPPPAQVDFGSSRDPAYRQSHVTAETGGIITDEDIMQVCKQHADHWKNIAEALRPSLDRSWILELTQNPFQQGDAQMFQVLSQWVKKNNLSASRTQLKRALMQCGLSCHF